MNRFYTLLSMILLLSLSLSAETTVTYTFVDKSFKDTEGNSVWKDYMEYFTSFESSSYNRGVQSSKTNKEITLNCISSFENISKISVVASTNGNNTTIQAKVGTDVFGTVVTIKSGTSSANSTYEFIADEPISGNPYFLIKRGESCTIWIKSISITYGDNSSETITKSNNPTFTPTSTSFGDEGLNVTISAEDGASIYYNLNSDSDPTIDNGILYTGAISLTETTTIKAISLAEGKEVSDVVSATYTYIESDSQKQYKLVTSMDELVDGANYLLMGNVQNKSTYYVASEQSGTSYRVATQIKAPIGDVITITNESVTPFTLGLTDGLYTLYDSLESVYLKFNDGNVITTSSLDTDCKFVFSIDNDNAVTIKLSGSLYTFQFNPSAPRFKPYSSTQNPIYLYKEITDDVVSLSAPVISVTEGSVDSDNRFSESITVAITCTTPDADLEYRLSETDEWIVYTQPIKIEQTTTIYARSLLAELIRESAATYTYFKTEVESIDEFKKMGPLDTSTVSSSNSLSNKGASFTFTCPLYVVEQEGERLFVTDKKDNFHNCMTILLKGNSGNSKTFAKGEEIPAGVKGYYVCYNDIVPELYINSFSATAEGHSSDEGCYLPEQSGTVVTLSPEIESVEKILAARTDTPDYSYMSKYVNIAYAWYTYNSIDSNAIIGYLSVPVDDSMEYEANAPMRVLGAGELTIPVYNLFGLSTQIPTESGLVSVAGVLDYSSTNGVGARFDPISFGVATGVENVNAPKDAIRVIGGNIVAPHGAKIYNLNGVTVGTDDLQPGIYIVRYADIAVKVVIR